MGNLYGSYGLTICMNYTDPYDKVFFFIKNLILKKLKYTIISMDYKKILKNTHTDQ